MYATGSHHAQFTMIPALSTDKQPMLVTLPMSSVSIENTWHVTGMKGTGSDAVVADNTRVETDDICSFADISTTPPSAIDEAALEATDYWVNYPLLRAKALGVLLGCAEGLLEAISAKSGGPIIYSTHASKRESGAYQYMLGEAETKIKAARRLIMGSNSRIDAAAARREVTTVEERTEFRGEGAFVIQTLSSAVDRLMDLGGSSAFGTAGPAQRYWRDYSTAARHVIFNPQVSYEQAGIHLLGIEPGVVTPDML